MKIQDICIDSELQKNINFLHDTDLQREFLHNNKMEPDHYEIITKYYYGHFGINDYYDSIQEIKAAYNLNIGTAMSEKESNNITAHFFIRIHNKPRGELWTKMML